jgi:hypothetical protein
VTATAEQTALAPIQMFAVEGGQQIQRTPMDMLNIAVARGDVELAAKLMDLAERWQKAQARRAFDEAIAAAKAEIPPIIKNRTVSYTTAKGTTTYQHEDFAEIARTVDPILAKHGLSYRFRTSSEVNQPVGVTCILSHRDGHYEENTLWAGRDDSGSKNSIQAIGSTQTYLQRYTLKAALGLAAAEDDDAKAAGAGPTINTEQMAKLSALITEVGADIAKFRKYMKVETLADIPSGQYQRAVDALEAKRAPK